MKIYQITSDVATTKGNLIKPIFRQHISECMKDISIRKIENWLLCELTFFGEFNEKMACDMLNGQWSKWKLIDKAKGVV